MKAGLLEPLTTSGHLSLANSMKASITDAACANPDVSHIIWQAKSSMFLKYLFGDPVTLSYMDFKEFEPTAFLISSTVFFKSLTPMSHL